MELTENQIAYIFDNIGCDTMEELEEKFIELSAEDQAGRSFEDWLSDEYVELERRRIDNISSQLEEIRKNDAEDRKKAIYEAYLRGFRDALLSSDVQTESTYKDEPSASVEK